MLVHRWKAAEPVTERLADSRWGIMSIHCDDIHAFCGQENGIVGVYNLRSGQLTKELAPPEEMLRNRNFLS